jgi:5-methyltetrahydropteroyltriglutamate--homocysteine methyltransferase
MAALPLLPTTMVGSYPRPSWFTHQLAGRDIWDAFKQRAHQEAFEDAVTTTLKDQEQAGLDLLTDGQMWFDDYVGGIGSFVWYWFERIPGFVPFKRPHPQVLARQTPDYEEDRWLEWGASTVVGEVTRGPLHLADLWRIAQRNTDHPVKMCVGAGPINLGFHVHYDHYKDQRELAYALAPIFNAELRELAAAGCRHIQLDDLGAWLPLISRDPSDAAWVVDVVNRTVEGVDAHLSWHFCFGNSWGNPAPNVVFGRGDYRALLADLYAANVHELALDCAIRDMRDVDGLVDLPSDKRVALGVVDVRTTWVETPGMVADRIRRALDVIPPDQLSLTTDCGMKHLPRFNAFGKLKALALGAAQVRAELAGS